MVLYWDRLDQLESNVPAYIRNVLTIGTIKDALNADCGKNKGFILGAIQEQAYKFYTGKQYFKFTEVFSYPTVRHYFAALLLNDSTLATAAKEAIIYQAMYLVCNYEALHKLDAVSFNDIYQKCAGKIKLVLEKSFMELIQPKIPELIDFIDDLAIKEEL